MSKYTKIGKAQWIICTLVFALLGGCISAPSRVDLGMLSNAQLCWRMNYLREHGAGSIGPMLVQQPEGTSYWEEIVSRGFFSQEELDLIEAQAIKIGMREEALVCSLGETPSVNKSVGSWGVHKQYVYRRIGWYVYVENGFVKSWQN